MIFFIVRGLLDTTLCDQVCQWLGRAISSTTKTDRHDKTEILLKVALNTITLDPYIFFIMNIKTKTGF
jgi:hypothetical protein